MSLRRRPIMRAIVRHEYGSPDVLELEEIEEPKVGDHDVLVKVHAASVNASDVELLTAHPLYVRLVGFGFRKPKVLILGSDIAGRVEVVGSNSSGTEELPQPTQPPRSVSRRGRRSCVPPSGPS